MMTEYAAGFAAGERATIHDQKHKVSRYRPQFITSEYQRGFWDGYTPRTVEWRMKLDLPREAA